jgi:anti-sigma regulatory factor (Ser/Thr protein kinase)
MVDVAQFAPILESLGPLTAFAAAVFERRGVPRELLPPVELALEELFTNMVKYGGERREPVRIEIAARRDGVEVTLTDHDVAQFDVTQAPAVDIARPLHERAPGGLGLHLTRRLVDRLEYRYDPQRREARIVFVKSSGESVAP